MAETEENVHLEVMTIQRTHHVIASGLKTKQKRREKRINQSTTEFVWTRTRVKGCTFNMKKKKITESENNCFNYCPDVMWFVYLCSLSYLKLMFSCKVLNKCMMHNLVKHLYNRTDSVDTLEFLWTLQKLWYDVTLHGILLKDMHST